MEITFLKESYINEVANMIVEKYQKARRRLPILPSKYENFDLHVKRLTKYINNESFVIATENNQVIGFMYGFPIDNFKGTVKGALVLPTMHYAKKDYNRSKVYNFMYSYISDKWAQSGCYTHCILLDMNDEDTFGTWFNKGFGMLVMDVVRNLDDIVINEENNKVIIKQGNKNDLLEIEYLLEGINTHLMSSPIFLYNKNIDENYIKRYSKWLENENNHIWIARINGEAIGYLKTNTKEVNIEDLDDDYTLAINGLYVKKEFRGQHIPSRLINAALAWAREKGLKRCTSDFETANYEGRTFWLKYFNIYSTGLIRRIDERNYINNHKK